MMNSVKNFEDTIKDFYGAKYAVATDCCTHAIELCLRLTKPLTVSCPDHTYLSIPMTYEKLGIDWSFKQTEWQDYYYLGDTNIIDAAVYWRPNGYIPNTLMCLSFQFKKHLSLGRGGMILTDDKDTADTLKKMSYDGRLPDIPWAEQDINTMGYHYYMTPESAESGSSKFIQAKSTTAKQWGYKDYPDLSILKVFK